jgi:hypothetical protein
MSAPSGRLVAFTPYGRRAGSSRARVFEWIDHLGLDAVVHSFTEANRAGVRELSRSPVASVRRHRALAASEVDPHDIILIHREMSPLSDGRPEERLLRAGARGVVDLDDGLQWDWGHGGWARRFRPKAPKIIRMVRAADVVIAGSDTIAEWASAYAEQVVVIPTCVEPSRYVTKIEFDIHDPPRIGWIGSAASEPHLATMGDELMRANQLTGARVALLGDDIPKLGCLESIIDREAWSENGAYERLATWDVGVMPLPDRMMERAKCAYKLLQYGAANLPALASCVGVNAEFGNAVIAGGLKRANCGRLIELLTGSTVDREASARQLHRTVTTSYAFSSWEALWRQVVYCDVGSARDHSDDGGLT